MELEATVSKENSGTKSSAWDEHTYRILGGAALGLLAMGTIVYHFLEEWSWVDSLYFSTVAVTTVGFGDLTPSTDTSKLFTVLYILSGITIVATFLRARLEVKHSRRRT